MLTLAEADFLISILSTVFVITMLSTFAGALYLQRFRTHLAILTGIMAALLLSIMALALAAPFLFPS